MKTARPLKDRVVSRRTFALKMVQTSVGRLTLAATSSTHAGAACRWHVRPLHRPRLSRTTNRHPAALGPGSQAPKTENMFTLIALQTVSLASAGF